MKRLSRFLIALCAVVVVSCSSDNEPVGLLDQSDIQSEVSTRLVFKDFEDFGTYFDSVKNDDQFTVTTRSSSLSNDVELDIDGNSEGKAIIAKFLEYTTMGKIFNSENEFQVGDTIIKLGNDGYTIFKIHKNSYKDANVFVNAKNSVAKRLGEFRKVADIEYELAKGITFYYWGDPLIMSHDFENTDIQLRAGPLVPYQLNVKFWTSYAVFYAGCGPEITSYKELQNGSYKDKSTNLRMIWSRIVVAFLPNPPPGVVGISHPDGIKVDTGSHDKKTFEEMKGVLIGKYYLTRGLITGEAQNSNGEWVRLIVGPGG
ncbi:MAG: hypothetical protein FWC41_12930 [Firmicutes bacterium]|nr:hypothetical protein [Bacillota bacterium]